MKLNQKVKSARVNKGLTQRQVCKATGIKETLISKAEGGKIVYYPKQPFIRKWAEVLDLDADDLILQTGRIPDRFKALVEEKSDEVLAFLKQLETDRQC